MAAPKGHDGQGGGRPPGAVNKTTANAREAIALFVEGNVERLNGWLDDIAKNSPKDAFNCFMDVVEYHVPKLNKTEHTGKNGKDLIPEQSSLSNADQKILERYNHHGIKKYLESQRTPVTIDQPQQIEAKP